MPQAIDTVGIDRLSGGGADTTFQAATAVAGDSLAVRNGAPSGTVELEQFMYHGRAGDMVRVRSPYLHDIAEGIQFVPGLFPSGNMLLKETAQVLRPQDNLIAEMLVNAITSHGSAALGIYYSDLPGASARLHTLADIANIIVNVKVMRVTMGAGGAAGVWLDTVITATEDVTRANTDYAVLGYLTDTACTCVAIKGPDTSNLRVGGPGIVQPWKTQKYFVEYSYEANGPRIPVFNSANKNGTFVSALNTASPTGMNVQLLCAQLAHVI